MGPVPILPVKLPVTISTMLKFDRHCHGDGNGVGMCKHTLSHMHHVSNHVSIIVKLPETVKSKISTRISNIEHLLSLGHMKSSVLRPPTYKAVSFASFALSMIDPVWVTPFEYVCMATYHTVSLINVNTRYVLLYTYEYKSITVLSQRNHKGRLSN